MALQVTNPAVYERMRQRAKAGNFGFLYGMGAEGFMVYALASFGVKVTLEEAEAARAAFFSTYARLDPWHKNYKAYARKHGYIRSPLGRLRHLPMINSSLSDLSSLDERRSVNAPVQSTLSDMSLWATALLSGSEHSQVVTMVHDQLVSYVSEDHWEVAAERTKQVMENLPFEKLGWGPKLKFTVDTEIGPNLADLKKVQIKEAA